MTCGSSISILDFGTKSHLLRRVSQDREWHIRSYMQRVMCPVILKCRIFCCCSVDTPQTCSIRIFGNTTSRTMRGDRKKTLRFRFIPRHVWRMELVHWMFGAKILSRMWNSTCVLFLLYFSHLDCTHTHTSQVHRSTMYCIGRYGCRSVRLDSTSHGTLCVSKHI